MNVVFFITSIFFTLSILRNTLFWVWLWQLKEYRLDRMRVHLLETTQGRGLLASPLLFLKLFTIGAYVVFILNPVLLEQYELFISGLVIIQGLLALREISIHTFRRPVPTFKSAGIAFIVLIHIWILYTVPAVDRFVWLLVLDRLVVILVTFFVLALYFPTEFYRDIQIENSVKKIKQYKKLLVIGITGSYGKSSTKEYIAQVLSKKFRVLKTKGTNNTPIGLANTVLHGLKDTTEIFVAEMGAYKIGEISQMTQMVHPKIGVLTAVNDQHLSLFGSIENTKKAKYELIESLPKDGLALFNGESKNVLPLHRQTKIKKVLYAVHELSEPKKGGSVFAKNIVSYKHHIEFDVVLNGKTTHYKTPLVGEHNIQNILPAIYIADYLGMTERDIKHAVLDLKPIAQTMAIHGLSHGPTVVDDTFNANPQSVLAALKYMKLYKGKRVLVLQPMIELGKNGAEEHYQVAKEIAKACDYLFLTNRNFLKVIEKGIADSSSDCLVQVARPHEIEEFITDQLQTGDVVVFEGKEAGSSLAKVL